MVEDPPREKPPPKDNPNLYEFQLHDVTCLIERIGESSFRLLIEDPKRLREILHSLLRAEEYFCAEKIMQATNYPLENTKKDFETVLAQVDGFFEKESGYEWLLKTGGVAEGTAECRGLRMHLINPGEVMFTNNVGSRGLNYSTTGDVKPRDLFGLMTESIKRINEVPPITVPVLSQ